MSTYDTDDMYSRQRTVGNQNKTKHFKPEDVSAKKNRQSFKSKVREIRESEQAEFDDEDDFYQF